MKYSRKHLKKLVPVVEGLEQRLMVSGSPAAAAVNLAGTLASYWTLPTNVVAGTALAGYTPVVVSNSGSAALPSSERVNIQVFAQDTSNPASNPITLATLNNQWVGGLKAGSSATFYAWVSLGSGLPADSYQIEAEITPVQSSSSSGGAGALATATAQGATRNISAASPFVNLVSTLSSYWTLPTSVVAGTFVAGYTPVVVSNLGNVPLPSGERVNIQIIAQDTTNPGNAPITLATMNNQWVGGLRPGASETFYAYAYLPSGLPADSYQVEAEVTPVQPLAAASAVSSLATASAQGARRTINVTNAFVNLTSTFGSKWTLPSSVQAGASFTGYTPVVISNLGNVSLPSNERVNIQIIAQDTTNPGDAPITLTTLNNQGIGGLRPGSLTTFNPWVNLSGGLPGDSYQVEAEITLTQPLPVGSTVNSLVTTNAQGAIETITAGKGATTTGLSSSSSHPQYGQPVTFTTSVSSSVKGAAAPSGTVTFMEGTAVMGSATIVNGKAVFTTSNLPVGTDDITAVYGGNGSLSASASAGLNETVSEDATTTTLTSSAATLASGQSVTFTAGILSAVGGSGMSGTVAFMEGTTVLATMSVSGGQASWSTSGLAAGSDAITAQYSGDGSNAASSSAPLVETVTAPAPIAPSQVTVEVVQTAQGSELVVLGTNGADNITISQPSATSMAVTTQQGTSVYTGDFYGAAVYGFDGNETITVAYGTTTAVTVYVGDGNSTVYDAGQGADVIYCGAGSDEVVTIGGSAKQVVGGTGMDSFWVGSKDTLTNVSAAETAAGNVHVVNQFYGGVSTAIAGQTFVEPTLGNYATGYANFSSQPLFAGTPNNTDIQQGALGDCYFLSSLAGIADTNPNSITQAVTSLGDGTYAVRFYQNGTPVYLRVDGNLPVYGTNLVYAHEGLSGDIWVAVMEKAYAYFRTGANSYSSLEGGWMAPVLTQVTNQNTNTVYCGTGSDQSMYNFIAGSLANNLAVTAANCNGTNGPIIGDHAYEVKNAFTSGGVEYVTVYNPWGYDGVVWDSNPSDGQITLTVTQFQQFFTAAVAMV